MNLVVQKKIDFTTTLIKGLNSLKNSSTINFDYYSVKPFEAPGDQMMLADNLTSIIRILSNISKEKLDVLLVTKVEEFKAEYYFYLRDFSFDENRFQQVVDYKPFYMHLLEMEQEWQKIGIEISTFNVSGCDDSCLLISFNSQVRNM